MTFRIMFVAMLAIQTKFHIFFYDQIVYTNSRNK